MIELVQADLIKLDKASRYREKCEGQEIRINRIRNLFGFLFFVSVLFYVITHFYNDLLIFTIASFGFVNVILPIISFVNMLLGIVVLAWLVIAILKSWNVKKATSEARRSEVDIAQNLYKLRFHKVSAC